MDQVITDMSSNSTKIIGLIGLALLVALASRSPWPTKAHAQESSNAKAPVVVPTESSFARPSTKLEARARAQLLYELSHGALQVIHRDFFDDENQKTIPSASLERVFVEMSRSYGVKMKWLNVGLDVMNVDHQPENEFEVSAAQQISKGEAFVELLDQGKYSFAGRIRLGSQCLKCHFKERRSTEDRAAGLVISMELADEAGRN